MNEVTALTYINKLVAIFNLLILCEYWLCKKSFLLNNAKSKIIIILGIASSLLLFKHPEFVTLVFYIQIYFLYKFRGLFNGGSDSMNLIILSAMSFLQINPSSMAWQKGVLYYIGVQAILSYFIAGLIKLRNPDWRSGRALKLIIQHSHYSIPSYLKNKIQISPMLAWIIIIFECLSPIVFYSPAVCIVFLIIAFGFHIANSVLLGLNRFTFAWLATYPAIYYLAAT